MAVAGAAKCFFGSHVIRTRPLYAHNTAAEAARAPALTAHPLPREFSPPPFLLAPKTQPPRRPSIDRGIRTYTETGRRTNTPRARARKHRLVFHHVASSWKTGAPPDVGRYIILFPSFFFASGWILIARGRFYTDRNAAGPSYAHTRNDRHVCGKRPSVANTCFRDLPLIRLCFTGV